MSDDDFLRVEASDCPMSSCTAPAGSPCRTGKGRVAAQYHTARFRLAPHLAKALSVPVPALRKPGSAWVEPAASPGYLAVVTEAGGLISVTESAGRIWAGLARRYGPSLVLLEHHPAPESGEGMETLDLVRIGADGSPRWSRVWPTPEENPRHAGWNGGWPLTGTRSSAGPRAGSIGMTTLTADC